jgi:hypothetical protein
MRYRPFGATYGMAVSTVTLLLDDSSKKSARDWRELIDADTATIFSTAWPKPSQGSSAGCCSSAGGRRPSAISITPPT